MGEETSVKVKFNNSVTGKKKLEEYAKTLQTINTILGGIDTGKQKQVNDLTKSTKKYADSDTKKIKNVGKSFEMGFNLAKLGIIMAGLKRFSGFMAGIVKESSDYVENINLLEVAFKRNGKSVDESSANVKKFVNTMSEVYGLDESRLVRSLGIFKQLSNAMQLPVETGERLSELMVKMTNDISSLYNIDLSRAENALQSALVG